VSNTALAWVDGQAADSLPLTDRGLAYGDGLFETLRLQQAQIPLWTRHLQRLQRGAERLRLPLDVQRLQQELQGFIAASGAGEGVIKLLVTRGSGQRGYAMPADARCRHLLQLSPLPVWPAGHAQQGIELFPCRTRLARQPLLAGLKHLNRLEQVLARSEWTDARYAEGLLRDTRGEVIEGTLSNLFALIDGRWVTPDLRNCGVRGVMRDWLIDWLQQQGQEVRQQPLTLKQLAQADELFCCNSLFGIWPVRALGRHRWPVGAQTRRLQDAVAQVFM